MPKTEPLLKPGGKWKPLIPSGPGAAQIDPLAEASAGRRATKMSKKELDKYRALLIEKRNELIGDITGMEQEALSGGPDRGATAAADAVEQGTDAYDQALSLDLAQVDRNLLRQITDALIRIEDGSYGICEITGKRISEERLEELPWTKYSIEAARELERNPHLA